jgi:hypothetical protein
MTQLPRQTRWLRSVVEEVAEPGLVLTTLALVVAIRGGCQSPRMSLSCTG